MFEVAFAYLLTALGALVLLAAAAVGGTVLHFWLLSKIHEYERSARK